MLNSDEEVAVTERDETKQYKSNTIRMLVSK